MHSHKTRHRVMPQIRHACRLRERHGAAVAAAAAALQALLKRPSPHESQ